ncbi:hypothetical protein ACHWQZ_G012718 [Mnemiopsis leidyi]
MEGNTSYKKLLIVTITLLFLVVMVIKHSRDPEYSSDNDQISISTNILDIGSGLRHDTILSDKTNDVSETDKSASVTDNNVISESSSEIQDTTLPDKENSTSVETSQTDTETVSNNTKVDFDLDNFPGIHSNLTSSEIATLKKSRRILEKIRENCKAQNISTVWNFWDRYTTPRLLIAKSRDRILYGSNPKTGSTSFKRFLFSIDGVKDSAHDFHGNPDGHYKIVHSKTYFENKRDFDRYVKMMGMRNPIVRVVSAFRDKQLRHEHYFQTPPNITDSEHFARFVQYRLPLWPEPDVHLMPQWKQMNICRFPYDVMIQFEEIGRYVPLIQKLTGTEYVEYPGSRRERGKDTHDSMEFVYQYWRELNYKQRQIVFNKYDMDFLLFGYTKIGEEGFPLLAYNDEIEVSL